MSGKCSFFFCLKTETMMNTRNFMGNPASGSALPPSVYDAWAYMVTFGASLCTLVALCTTSWTRMTMQMNGPTPPLTTTWGLFRTCEDKCTMLKFTDTDCATAGQEKMRITSVIVLCCLAVAVSLGATVAVLRCSARSKPVRFFFVATHILCAVMYGIALSVYSHTMLQWKYCGGSPCDDVATHLRSCSYRLHYGFYLVVAALALEGIAVALVAVAVFREGGSGSYYQWIRMGFGHTANTHAATTTEASTAGSGAAARHAQPSAAPTEDDHREPAFDDFAIGDDDDDDEMK